MSRFQNLAAIAPGNYRNFTGGGDEHLAIGRATQADLFTFFRAWRDQPDDVVIYYKGECRVEIKGCSTERLDCTRRVELAFRSISVLTAVDCIFRRKASPCDRPLEAVSGTTGLVVTSSLPCNCHSRGEEDSFTVRFKAGHRI